MIVPTIFGAIVIISLATFPITLTLRLLGHNYRFFYPIGIYYLCNIGNYVFYHYDKSITKIMNFIFSDGSTYSNKQKEQTKTQQKENTSNNSSDNRKSQTQTTKQDPFEILRVKKGATKEEIIKAYKVKMSLNHPDKVANMDKEIQELAVQRAKIINEAYSQLVG